MRTCMVFVMVCVVSAGFADAQSPVEIVDGRTMKPWIDWSAWVIRPPIQQASTAARTYWREQDETYEEEIRVVGVVEGAFTQPEAKQQAVLYLMSLWPRCCPKMGIAIIEGDRLVRNVAFDDVAQELAVVPDLDGDDRDELFYTGSFGMGGEESSSLTYIGFAADSLFEIGSTSISESTCATGREDASSRATRVLAQPGPTFIMEQYTQDDCEDQTWQLVKGPEPFELFASSNRRFIDLPVEKMQH